MIRNCPCLRQGSKKPPESRKGSDWVNERREMRIAMIGAASSGDFAFVAGPRHLIDEITNFGPAHKDRLITAINPFSFGTRCVPGSVERERRDSSSRRPA